MKVDSIEPVRTFKTGVSQIEIKHCANILLEDNEQITFLTKNAKEYDVVKKSWGFYATPSLNGRLKRFGLSPVLVKNKESKYYICLVENDKRKEFYEYLKNEEITITFWLDDDKSFQQLYKLLDRDDSYGE